MTPDEFNTLVRAIAEVLRGDSRTTDAELVIPADDDGTSPEIGLTYSGVDLFLTVSLV